MSREPQDDLAFLGRMEERRKQYELIGSEVQRDINMALMRKVPYPSAPHAIEAMQKTLMQIIDGLYAPLEAFEEMLDKEPKPESEPEPPKKSDRPRLKPKRTDEPPTKQEPG